MSNIQWTDETWNPSTGCTAISPGCDHCYAATMAKRLQAMGEAKRDKLFQRAREQSEMNHRASAKHTRDQRDRLEAADPWKNGFTFTEHPQRLLEPLRWKKPRRVFVCSMADLFHERATDEHIARVWAVMAACPQHTFQVLTKRPHRMAAFLRSFYGEAGRERRAAAYSWLRETLWPGEDLKDRPPLSHGHTQALLDCDRALASGAPLPNVWLGTSVESQEVTRPGWHPALGQKCYCAGGVVTNGYRPSICSRCDGAGKLPVPGRIDALLECPAAVRFLSCEPLLGPLDLAEFLAPASRRQPGAGSGQALAVALGGASPEDLPGGDAQEARPAGAEAPAQGQTGERLRETALSWLICGGESGPGARPMHPAWARSLRDQCAAAGVAFFFKQFGAWLPEVNPLWGPKTSFFKCGRCGSVYADIECQCPESGYEQCQACYRKWGEQMAQEMERCERPDFVMRKSGGHNGDPANWPAHLADLNVRQFPEGK